MLVKSFIERILWKNDKVIIFDDRNKELEQLKKILLQYLGQRCECNIMVLGMKKYNSAGNSYYRQITEEEYEEIFELFRTYEFTDILKIVLNTNQYGSMLNYIKTGVLSVDEYIEATIH